jgi:hypothetical protein
MQVFASLGMTALLELLSSPAMTLDNSGNDLSSATRGSVVFTTTIAAGDADNVTVKTRPTNPSACSLACKRSISREMT